jgi:hypothetical protein
LLAFFGKMMARRFCARTTLIHSHLITPNMSGILGVMDILGKTGGAGAAAWHLPLI